MHIRFSRHPYWILQVRMSRFRLDFDSHRTWSRLCGGVVGIYRSETVRMRNVRLYAWYLSLLIQFRRG